MKKGITVIYSSHKGELYDEKFEQKVKSTIGIKNVDIVRIENFGEYSLPQAYNLGWERGLREDYILLFVHNDVHFQTKNWGYKLLYIFNNENFDIIGLAGTDYLADNGIWWHDRSRCYGIVNHTDGAKEWETAFAPPLKKTKPVVVIDGLFIAVNPDNIIHKFDEEFKGFHLYDISFVFPNFLDGCNVGVTTEIRLLHESVGMVNAEWHSNRAQFADKYKSELPFDLNDE